MADWHYIEGEHFALEECHKCGVRYLFPYARFRVCKEKGPPETFYCPNGHSAVFREGEAAKLRRERDLLTQRLACRDDELKAANKQVIATKGQLTRLRRRAKAGMCPCCNRTFSNMTRHIQTKHPEFRPEVELAVVEGGKK